VPPSALPTKTRCAQETCFPSHAETTLSLRDFSLSPPPHGGVVSVPRCRLVCPRLPGLDSNQKPRDKVIGRKDNNRTHRVDVRVSMDRRWTLRKKINARPCLPHAGFCSIRTGCRDNHKQQSRAIAVTNNRCVVFGLAVDTSARDSTSHLSAWFGEPSSSMCMSGSNRHPKHGTCVFDPKPSCAKLFGFALSSRRVLVHRDADALL
jgi:hypothetical protein